MTVQQALLVGVIDGAPWQFWKLSSHARRVGVSVVAVILSLTAQTFAQTDPLPSWHNTPTKQAILEFVAKVTRAGGPDFAPVRERLTVFDMDGTLVPEKPIPLALIPVLADIKEAVAKKPWLGDRPAVAALLKGDEAALHDAGEQGINDLIAVATDGKTTEEIVQNVRPLMEKTTHQKFGVPYARVIYQPMLELLAHLEANGFTSWICSGSPVLITRELTEGMFGIPPERVMGSHAGTTLDERAGRTMLVFDGRVGHLNDREGKPVTINLALGTRPLFVGGNEGGRGDIAMMRWSKDRKGPSFQLLINHDDAEREFAYAEPDSYSLNAARTYGFHVVSIKRDWKTIVAR
jgi:phosphoglycolate phosphatase-like HAD superfamily hydrolase